MKVRLSRILAAMVVLAGAVAGCGGAEAVDKAGGDTLVLHLASIDSVNNNGQSYGPQAFVDALAEVSGGRLEVEVTAPYGDGAPDAESNLVEAIASGAIDGGWPSTRAFSGAGITGLEVVEAPMTITSYEAEKALVSGSVAEELLAQLDGTGVVGLGLTVGPLRRPFANAALLGPEEWAGARFRVYNSPIQADAVTALGGEPVNAGFEWLDQVVAGDLRGAEFDIAQYWTNGFTTEAGIVTSNVVLWPKVFVLSISEKRFDTLSDQQQSWVREAADRAVQTSVDADYDETTPARRLCELGVRFVAADPEQLTALGAMLAPVIDQLAAAQGSGELLDRIQAIAAEHAEPEMPDVGDDCRQPPSETGGEDAVPEEVSDIPDGLYRVEVSEADVEAAGFSNGPGWSGIWSMQISDGTYAVTCRHLDTPGRDCGNLTFDEFITFDTVLDAGFVRGTGNTVYFVYDGELHSELTGCELPCFPLPTYSLTWEMDGDALSFTGSQGDEPVEKLIKPWRKID